MYKDFHCNTVHSGNNWNYDTEARKNDMERSLWAIKWEKQDTVNYVCYDPTFVKEKDI